MVKSSQGYNFQLNSLKPWCSIQTITVTHIFMLVSHATDHHSLLYVPVLVHIDYVPLRTLHLHEFFILMVWYALYKAQPYNDPPLKALSTAFYLW